jgi:hypothetical protein
MSGGMLDPSFGARNRSRGVRAVALAFAMLAYTACSTMQVRTDYDRTADFARYHSFALQKGAVLAQGAVDARNTLVRDRIDRALRAGLASKGLAPATGDPELLVTYVAGARSRQEIEHVDWAYPWGPFWGGPGYQDFWLTDHEQGTLVIDFVDASTRKLVWRGMIVAEDQPFAEQAFIDKAVGKALQLYPPRG